MLPIKAMTKNLGGVISKNSPTILTVVAVGGLITTVVLAVRATPKAMQMLDYEVRQRWEEDKPLRTFPDSTKIVLATDLLTKKEVIKLVWKCYIPASLCGVATIGCIIGAHGIHLQRTAALASVYSITETAFKEYQAKVGETIGRNKESKMRDEIDADRIKKNPPNSSEVIFTGKGEALCCDSWSGRYFKSDIESIRRSENNLNKMLLNEDHITLNDLYFEFGIPSIKYGDDIGWHIETGMLDFRFSSQLTEKEEPCLVVDYNIKPTANY